MMILANEIWSGWPWTLSRWIWNPQQKIDALEVVWNWSAGLLRDSLVFILLTVVVKLVRHAKAVLIGSWSLLLTFWRPKSQKLLNIGLPLSWMSVVALEDEFVDLAPFVEPVICTFISPEVLLSAAFIAATILLCSCCVKNNFRHI